METKVGIKETLEVLNAVDMVGLYVIKRVKDGVGVDDAMDLFTKIISDEEFKKVLSDAIKDIKKVPEEIKDLDALEGVELGTAMLSRVPKFLEALKK